jgi:hypothetical protein
VRAHGRTYLNKAGETVYKEETASNMTSWDLAYYLLRANFNGVDSEYLEGRAVPAREEGEGKATHLHDHCVTGLEECDGGRRMRVHYPIWWPCGPFFCPGPHRLKFYVLLGAYSPTSKVEICIILYHPACKSNKGMSSTFPF